MRLASLYSLIRLAYVVTGVLKDIPKTLAHALWRSCFILHCRIAKKPDFDGGFMSWEVTSIPYLTFIRWFFQKIAVNQTVQSSLDKLCARRECRNEKNQKDHCRFNPWKNIPW